MHIANRPTAWLPRFMLESIRLKYLNPTSRTRAKYPTSLSVPFLNIFDPVDINFWNFQVILILWRWFFWHFQIFCIFTSFRDNERKRIIIRTSVKQPSALFRHLWSWLKYLCMICPQNEGSPAEFLRSYAPKVFWSIHISGQSRFYDKKIVILF